MKLIIDDPVSLDGSIEEELNESSGVTERNYYLSGIFSTPEKKNRNGRIYSRAIWEREVAKYQEEIKNKTVNTLGEWQHPPRSTIDPMKAVIRITELKFKSDGNVWGKCKILNNNSPETNAIKGLIKEGVKIGISTRGVGKVSATGIVEDFKLITADLVDMPSDYNAMLNGVTEGYVFENGIMQDKEYSVDENGCIGEVCDIAMSEKHENKEEKCPIASKIEEEVQKAKEDIFNTLDEYLKESFDIVDNKRKELVEHLSNFLGEKIELPETNLARGLEENTEKKITEEDVIKLVEALKNKK